MLLHTQHAIKQMYKRFDMHIITLPYRQTPDAVKVLYNWYSTHYAVK